MGDFDSEHKRQATARIGSILREKWRLDMLLGLGGMAAVYAATHRNGKQAAIKVLHPQAALVPDIRARFLREGYLANKVGHAGAVSIIDDDVDVDGTVFLVMELLDGETLETRWNREKMLHWQQMFLIADKVLEVLISAHNKDIVHRDLKPGNVFICADGNVKVLDFGIARLQGIAQSARDTGGHISLGTPGFMPQEQARGQWAKVDAQSDLWALGATMFAVIAGRYVHEAPTVNEQLLAAMTEPVQPIREVFPNLPREVAELIDRSLSFDKERRWPNAAAMQGAVREVYEKLLGQPIAAAAPITVPGAARHRSVVPDAPTVAASDVDSLRSSARSVSSRRDESAAKRSQASSRRPWPLLVAGAGAVLVIAGWLATRSAPVAPAVGPSQAPMATTLPPREPFAITPPPVEPAALPETTTEPPAVSAAPARRGLDERVADPAHQPPLRAVSRPSRNAKTRTPAPAPVASASHAPPAAAPPASASAPAAPVDIFTRRK